MKALFLIALAFAQQAAPVAAAAAAPAGAPAVGPDLTRMAITIGMLILIFYLIILRPQRTEARKREETLNSVGKGDQVMTSSGILGTVESVDTAKAIVTLNVAPKVSMRFARSAIQTVLEKKKGKESDSEQETKVV